MAASSNTIKPLNTANHWQCGRIPRQSKITGQDLLSFPDINFRPENVVRAYKRRGGEKEPPCRELKLLNRSTIGRALGPNRAQSYN